MTTQTQGKGKKKNKEVMKVSLDEFNQIDAPLGHSVVSLRKTGIDWVSAMADYDKQTAETQQIIVPTTTRTQRGPGVDYDSLPDEPPFQVSVFNLPMSVEEKEIQERFFQGIDIRRIDIAKTSTTVELGSKDDLYEALCKDGSSIKNRTVNVCLYGQSPQPNYSDRYGARGSNSYGDRYGDRNQGGFGGSRGNDRYNDRNVGFNRERDNYGGFNRGGGGGGFGQSRSGGYDRYQPRGNFRDNRGSYTSGGGEPESEEPSNWRARPAVKQGSPPSSYNNGSRSPYVHSRPEPSHYQHNPSQSNYNQPEGYHQSRYQHHHHPTNLPYSQYNNQAGSRPLSSSSSATEERPKLVLHKRKTPLKIDDVVVNEAIFGQAKPSSTPYQKMNEVEERLKAVHIDNKVKEPVEEAPAEKTEK